MRYSRHALRRVKERLKISRADAHRLLRRLRTDGICVGQGARGATRWAVPHLANGRTWFVVFVVSADGCLVITLYRLFLMRRKTKAEPVPSVLTEQEILRTRVVDLEARTAALKGQLDDAEAECRRLTAEHDEGTATILARSSENDLLMAEKQRLAAELAKANERHVSAESDYAKAKSEAERLAARLENEIAKTALLEDERDRARRSAMRWFIAAWTVGVYAILVLLLRS